ncbi:MAG: glucose-6-phosphate isomerase, partial [Bdellovibrionota bacterium]
ATKPDDTAALALARKSLAQVKSRQEIGFLQLTDRAQLWSSSEQRAREVRKSAHTLAVLGMGGSSLGGRAVINALKNFKATHEVEFVDNVDSDRFWKWLKGRKDLGDIHWVIVSKSGNTIETLTMAELVDQHLVRSGFKKLAAVSTIVSETKDNPLTRWAKKEGVPQLEIPVDVGGRFSVLTPVGLLPAAFYGLDLAALREGAAWALAQDELVSRLVAQSLMSFAREEWISLFWAYSDGLRDFGAWTQQLWAESLGKAKGRDGKKAPRASTPMPAIGSSDQHSILQQVMEGARDKFIWFLRVNQSEDGEGPVIEKNLFDGQELMLEKTMGRLFGAMAAATRDALAHEGVQSLTLTADRLEEKELGALFMLLELVVGALGEAHAIDAFDQPGVELGKKLARQNLA